MTDNVKILLTIYMEGGILVRQDKPEIILFDIKHDLPGGDGKSESGTKKHYNKVSKDAVRNMKLNEETYNMMLTEAPRGMKSFVFNKLSETQKIESHLRDYCHDFGGKSFSYKINDF